ncbi:MAG: hypothetical protein ACR2QT_09655 [Woeseiaceae bacterium]
MRSLIVMAMFVATLSNAAWNGYTESRDLAVSADGVDLFEIDAGAGEIVVNGVTDATEINVIATIRVDDDDDDARELIAKNLVLNLESKRSKAILNSYFDSKFWHNYNAAVDLEVRVPQGLEIFIDDGSGPVTVIGVASVAIDDGSGSIEIAGVTGDVMVDDGSGDISIRDVGGTVTIDDGSGSIDVKNVEQDLEIVDDGSGSVRIADVRGSVRHDD